MNLEKMYIIVYEKPLAVKLLRLFCHVCEALFAIAFLFSLYLARIVSIKVAISLLFLSLASFLLLSVARRLINAPRPADVFPHLSFLKTDKMSASFPSRHVFSAALISVIMLFNSNILGISFIILSLLLAFARVLLGRHFPRDVIAGWLIGAFAGTVVFYLSYNVFMV